MSPYKKLRHCEKEPNGGYESTVSSNSYPDRVQVRAVFNDRRRQADKVCHSIEDFEQMPFGKYFASDH